ncbi:hypothetical protein WH47_04376 [Habropoda laboriosa]|uniref:Uncharacterized protein n=1 Tax=Habropoda laboriosa TaxID=597456 RepID=A0A0L7QR55_9HYME|nr:hypothetical protein WH47_04376 [Habropoda laboriosa]
MIDRAKTPSIHHRDVFCRPYQYLAIRSAANFVIDRTINLANVDSNLLPNKKLRRRESKRETTGFV